MKMFRRLSSVVVIVLLMPLILVAMPVPAAQADQLPNPDWVALLSDYEKDYWQAPTDAAHGGKVLDAKTMELDQNLAVAINHKAAEDLDNKGLNAQRKRALVDSDLQAEETMPDALGPVLGAYMSEGLKQGKLNAVADVFSFNAASTYASKRAAMHPRPYLNRAESSFGGTNDLAGLSATLNIKQSPSWLEHVPGYSNLQKNSSYPSGHTTGAYSWGIALAGMIPELAPQIMARTSEAGNNRIVLGVHYPLDIMGGRIGASAQNGQYWHNEFSSSIVPAARQLRGYLTERCQADEHGSTLAACIANVKANGAGGYTNGFLDSVASEPVKDQPLPYACTPRALPTHFRRIPPNPVLISWPHAVPRTCCDWPIPNCTLISAMRFSKPLPWTPATHCGNPAMAGSASTGPRPYAPASH